MKTDIFTLLLKTWSISDRQIKLGIRFNNMENSFTRLAKDFKEHIKHK